MDQRPTAWNPTPPWPLLRKVWFETLALDWKPFSPEVLVVRPLPAELRRALSRAEASRGEPGPRPTAGWGRLA